MPPISKKRVQGVREEAKKYPGISIRDVYYHKETPQDARRQGRAGHAGESRHHRLGHDRRLAALHRGTRSNGRPGTVKCVAVDALPAQLAYIRSGHVPVLLAQQCYEWGHRTVELLVEKIVLKKETHPP